MRNTVLLLFAAVPALAGEYAVLDSGFRIRAERHEQTPSGIIRLHTETGVVEFPAGKVLRFEQEEYTPPPPAEPTKAEAGPAPAPQLTPRELVEQAAAKHNLRPEFVASIARAESAFRQEAVSPKGARGLMQIMPGTAAELGVDAHDPAQNAEGGARYLRQLLERYKDRPDGVRLAIAAYNAGPGAVDRYGNIPPYRETRAYVDKVVKQYLLELNKKNVRQGS